MTLPQITYGPSAWYVPVDPNGNYKDKAVRKLEAIQRRAAKVITGAFKTVSGPALDGEAFRPGTEDLSHKACPSQGDEDE